MSPAGQRMQSREGRWRCAVSKLTLLLENDVALWRVRILLRLHLYRLSASRRRLPLLHRASFPTSSGNGYGVFMKNWRPWRWRHVAVVGSVGLKWI